MKRKEENKENQWKIDVLLQQMLFSDPKGPKSKHSNFGTLEAYKFGSSGCFDVIFSLL